MKLLLDHCVPKRLGRELIGHQFKTAFQMGWADVNNGALLTAAAKKQFDAFITVDQNIRYQHNLAKLPLSVLILVARDNKLVTLLPFIPSTLQVLSDLPKRALTRIHQDGRIEMIFENS